MSEIKHKAQILATIDHLRGRKARPDIHRICTFMLKKFKVGLRETKADLKKCIKTQSVYKVVYKGNVSYRNAARKRKSLKSATPKTNKMKAEKKLITMAMVELMNSETDSLEQGIPHNKLLKAMAAKENSTLSRKYLEGIIEKELESGSLVKMENGNLTLLGAVDRDQDSSMEAHSFNTDSNTKMISSNNSSTTSSPMRLKGKPGRKKGSGMNKLNQAGFARTDAKKLTGIRVGERHKRAKKVFDPSDNNVPAKKKRGRPVGSLNKTTIKKHSPPVGGKSRNMYPLKVSESGDTSDDDDDTETNDSHSMIEPRDKVTGGVCSVCRQHKNAKDNSGILISCRDCSNKAHPTCLRGDGMLRLRPDNTWQCPHCKTCVVCIETNDAGTLTVCSVCADAYHALCHSPSIPERLKAWDQWECRNCQDTKNSGHNLDPAYIEKTPGSDHSSKYSDRSDSRKSNKSCNDKRRDKSSVQSGDTYDRNESKLVIAEKDERSYSPASLDNMDWKRARKLESPARSTLLEWKESEGKTPPPQGEGRKPKLMAGRGKPPHAKSIYMNDHELQQYHSSITFQKHPNDNGDSSVDPSIPNAERWNTNDVYLYFSSYFPEEAHVFKEKEIDGLALLMMRRNDVIHNFGLPLGPALKMYRHVVKLQTRKDDFTMCWM